jgi:hypothetical protein
VESRRTSKTLEPEGLCAILMRSSRDREKILIIWLNYGRLRNAELITSQSQNDYVGLEVGAKTEAIHFLGFAV